MKFKLSPLTRKRFENFMHIRRAVFSLVLLITLFVISLFSEFICNSEPLYIRYNGRSFFPFIQNVTQMDLDKGGQALPVNFKKFTATEAFTTNPANKVVWTPIPFGPGEVIDARSLEAYRTVKISVVPEAHVGRFDLLPDGRISRSVACGTFFPGAKSADGLAFESLWSLSVEAKASIAKRLAGEEVPPETFPIKGIGKNSSRTARISLPPLPKRTAPGMVRVMILQSDPPDSPFTLRVHRDERGELTDFVLPVSGVEQAGKEIAELAKSCFTHTVQPTTIEWRNGRKAVVTCSLTNIAWPFHPVPGHWMGIDAAGRDVFSRILYGMRIALSFGLALAVWSMFFGVLIGATEGYFGGWIDMTGQRITEIWHAVPFLYVMIFIGSAVGRSFWILLVCYGIFNWIGVSYYMRAEFLRLRQRTFVEAARCQGLSPFRIIFFHILPNGLTPLITLFPFNLMGAIGSLAALDFLGFGLPPMTPSWGELLHQAQQFRWAWWLILFPATTLFIVMLLSVIVGEGLRDAFDPRQRSHME